MRLPAASLLLLLAPAAVAQGRGTGELPEPVEEIRFYSDPSSVEGCLDDGSWPAVVRSVRVYEEGHFGVYLAPADEERLNRER